MLLRKIIKSLTPPIIIYLLNFFKKKNYDLFVGEKKLFFKNISNSSIYGEYGCGISTQYVLKNFNIPIYSVDTSQQYINLIKKNIENNLNLKYIDVGELLSWGTPKDYSLRKNFLSYCSWIWEQEQKPTVVLIDGRFRVCCFLVSLKLGNPGTKIIFDDYVCRPEYHIVEEFIKPIEKDKRQSLFIIPEKKDLDLKKIDEEINKFQYVKD